MTLNMVPDGETIFIDANIFIYHFTGVSSECSHFLSRCESGLLKGITTVHILLEVLHRLMMLEAVSKGFVEAGNVARKLKERPDIVKNLRDYAIYGLQIPEMGVHVFPCGMDDCRYSQQKRESYGLMTNDSVLLASMLSHGCYNLATADAAFDNVKEISIFKPGDI